MKKGIEVVIRDDVLLFSLAVKREHDEKDLILEQAVFQVAIDREHSCVVFVGVGRALLEVNGKQSEPPSFLLNLRGTTGPAQQLEQVPAVLFAETIQT
jgi:hypothetical protein